MKEKFDICRQADRVAELVQLKRRLSELKAGEQKLLVKYADPTNSFSEEALNGAVSEIHNNVAGVQAQILGLEVSITSEEELMQKVGDIHDMLNKLKERIKDASMETKRKIFEILVKEIRVGVTADGIPCLDVVYWFDGALIEADSGFQLHSSRVPLWIFWRSLPSL